MITYSEIPIPPIQSFTFLNTLGTAIDGNGCIILFPFTAISDGIYVFDMTVVTTVGNNTTGVISDTTTQLTINGVWQVGNVNFTARSQTGSGVPGVTIGVTHNHKAQLNLSAGDVAYFGAGSSTSAIISNGAMIIYKIG